MKVLDRYIIRELLSPIIYACVALVFLILIADLFDNLDELLTNKTPVSIIVQYYSSLVPFALIQILPWATWLGTIFLLVNFGFHNETIAMKAAGLKITTIIRPILFAGFLIGIFAFLVSDRIVPPTYRVANELREVYIEKKKEEEAEKIFKNVTYFSKGNELYYFRTFSKRDAEVRNVVVLWLDTSQRNRRKKMIARRGLFRAGAWEFYGVTEYQMDSRGRILGEPRTYERKRFPNISFTPNELASASTEGSFLSYRDLKTWIKKLKENGVRVSSETVDLHYRLAAPWHGLVMMLITIPFLARTTNRKLIAFNVLLCVGLIFVYHVLGAVSIAMGKAGKIFPFASAWAGNILFAAGAFFTLEKANH